ncbi:unnamed protein product, partial [Medioppia subpectinata]
MHPLSHNQSNTTFASNESLRDYEWFYTVEREDAEALLLTQEEDGAYLVRESKRAGKSNPYTLTIFHNGRVFHLNIRKRPDGLFALGKEKTREKTFKTVSDLVSYHTSEPILLTTRGTPAGKTLCLKMTVNKRGKACWQIRTASNGSLDTNQSLSVEECIKAAIIFLITVAVIVLNALMIVVLHSKNYSRYLRDLPKILMTSLSLTDLAVGTLVTPISFLSVVNQCWPWNQTVCAIEALLISALFHESTLSLLCIAIDRYICIVHPLRYHNLMTKKDI